MKQAGAKAKRIAAAVSALLFAFCSLPFFIIPARADEAPHSAFTKPSLEVDSEALYKRCRVLDDFSDVEAWVGSDDVKSVERSTYTGGADCVLAKADGEGARALSISRAFTDEDGAGVAASGYEELSFSVVFGGDGDSYTLTAAVGTTGGEVDYSCAISPDVGQDVFLDLSVEGVEQITSFSLTVEANDAKSTASYVALSSLVIGDVSHAQVASRFSALYVYGGEITDEGIKVTPKDQTALVRAEAVLPTGAKSAGSTAMISLTLRGVGFAKITMQTSSYPAWRKNEYKEMTSLTVTSETETYVFCFDQPDKIASWALSFEALSTTGNDFFYIEDVTLDFGGSAQETTAYLSGAGTIAKCAYTGEDSIAVTGTVTHDAVVDHIDGKLALFIIPAWQSVEDALAGEPALVSDISTSFNFNVPLEEYPTASGSRFAVALTDDGKPTLISPPTWASPSTSFVQNELPRYIASSPSVAATFECGAQSAIIDVDVSKLIRPSNDMNSRLVAWGDSIFYFSQTILTSISSDAAFLDASGIKYQFRLLCSTDRFSAAPGTAGTYYAADVSTRSNCEMLCAVVDYLSDRFSPSGYILGDRLNVRQKNTTQLFSDAFSLMEQSARCARLIYSVAQRYDPYTVLVLPFDALAPAIEAEGAPAADAVHSAITCTALADFYISRDPTPIRWTSLVAANEESADDVPSIAATNHGSGYIGTAITSPNGEATSLSELAERFPLALFYVASVEEFEPLEKVAPNARIAALPTSPEGYSGSVALWDFSRSFSADSFVLSNRRSLSTGACPVFTALGERSSERVLYLDLSASDGVCPTVAASAPLADATNLENASAIEFRLAAFSDSYTSGIVIHMGNDAVRLRCRVTLVNAKACSVVCPLPDGVRPTYFSISAEASDGVSVRLYSVNALSETLGDDELRESVFRLHKAQSAAQTQSSERYMQLAIALISGVTVAAFVVLNRITRHRNEK